MSDRSEDPLLRNTQGTGFWQPLVVIVDEDEARRAEILATLEGQSCKVIQTSGGEDALGRIGMVRFQHPPDLVVLRDPLPQMSNTEFRRRLSIASPDVEVPVLSFSGTASGLSGQLTARIRALVNQRRMRKIKQQLEGSTDRLKARTSMPPSPPSKYPPRGDT